MLLGRDGRILYTAVEGWIHACLGARMIWLVESDVGMPVGHRFDLDVDTPDGRDESRVTSHCLACRVGDVVRMTVNPLRTVGHRPRRIKLQHKAPSKGVKKHCLLLSLGRDNRQQRVNPLSTVVHHAKRAPFHAKAPSKGVQKHSLPISPYGLFGWLRVNPLRTVGHR